MNQSQNPVQSGLSRTIEPIRVGPAFKRDGGNDAVSYQKTTSIPSMIAESYRERGLISSIECTEEGKISFKVHRLVQDRAAEGTSGD